MLFFMLYRVLTKKDQKGLCVCRQKAVILHRVRQMARKNQTAMLFGRCDHCLRSPHQTHSVSVCRGPRIKMQWRKPKIHKRVGTINNQIYYEKISINCRVRILIMRMWRIFSKANGGIQIIAGFQPDSKRQACKII